MKRALASLVLLVGATSGCSPRAFDASMLGAWRNDDALLVIDPTPEGSGLLAHYTPLGAAVQSLSQPYCGGIACSGPVGVRFDQDLFGRYQVVWLADRNPIWLGDQDAIICGGCTIAPWVVGDGTTSGDLMTCESALLQYSTSDRKIPYGGSCRFFGSAMGCSQACGPNSYCSGGQCTCVDGYGDCDGNPDNGCERPLDGDVNNCGGCGIACAPGEVCQGGCLKVLASGQSGPVGIAVDGTSVYWTNNSAGTVMKAPLGGGSPVTLASGQDSPAVIAVDATGVYFGDFDGAVMEVPLAGGAPEQLASVGDPIVGIAVDATSVYFSAFGKSVMSVPREGGSPITLASGLGPLGGLAVDATSVYFTGETGSVVKAPLGGGPPTILASGQTGALGIAVDQQGVYWTRDFGDTVATVPVGGGAVTTIAFGSPLAEGEASADLAVDGSSVYWTNDYAGTVMKAPVGGGPPTVLASGQNEPRGIAVDGTSVYWADERGDTIMSRPK